MTRTIYERPQYPQCRHAMAPAQPSPTRHSCVSATAAQHSAQPSCPEATQTFRVANQQGNPLLRCRLRRGTTANRSASFPLLIGISDVIDPDKCRLAHIIKRAMAYVSETDQSPSVIHDWNALSGSVGHCRHCFGGIIRMSRDQSLRDIVRHHLAMARNSKTQVKNNGYETSGKRPMPGVSGNQNFRIELVPIH
ncbi:hypothetical protein CC80DRAFT_530935 [Byssothecium circinans]|uniref:Uncharacterized protein n=1 Tax=Byssothecium circinans TaxID=147558 RepID=A0A6A5UE99_9PLEO|nr:hypothetical protein CC80DRAFT_530935 [Byssothecium circinans]